MRAGAMKVHVQNLEGHGDVLCKSYDGHGDVLMTQRGGAATAGRSLLARLYAFLRVLWYASPCGIGFFVPRLGEHGVWRELRIRA